MTGICNSVLPYLRNLIGHTLPASLNEHQRKGILNRRKQGERRKKFPFHGELPKKV
jgi:hypothetical protein